MWARNYQPMEARALPISERDMLGEFLQYDELGPAVTFANGTGGVTQSLQRLMDSLGIDEVSFRATKKLAEKHPALFEKVAIGTFRELFPMQGLSMVRLLHVQLSALTACHKVICPLA
jgi:hypothetical protein